MTLPNSDWHWCDPHVTWGADVDGDECKPDDAGGVHAESYKFRLIEGFWYFSCEDSIYGANYD